MSKANNASTLPARDPSSYLNLLCLLGLAVFGSLCPNDPEAKVLTQFHEFSNPAAYHPAAQDDDC